MHETAPALVCVWRHLADRVIALTKVEPLLLKRLTTAPRPAFHAYCAFLAATIDEPATRIAPRIHATAPRALVAAAFPGHPGTDRLSLVLRRICIDHALPLRFYADLADLAVSEIGGVLAGHQITDEASLCGLKALARHVATDPLLAAAARAMTPTLREVSRMTDVLAVLSTHGATEGLRDRLDACRTPEALAYRLAQDFMSLEMVDHGIDFGSHFRRLARIMDLKAVGRRYHNCLRKMPPYLVSRCLAGQSVMLEFDTRTETGVLVQLDVVSPHVRPLLVRIESILGPGNEQPVPAIEEDVRRQLRSVPGMRVVHRELHECLAPIFERISKGSDLEEIAQLLADRREVGPDELVAL